MCCALAPQEYKIHNCDLLFKEDSTVDDLIDVIEGNRRYVKCERARGAARSVAWGFTPLQLQLLGRCAAV